MELGFKGVEIGLNMAALQPGSRNFRQKTQVPGPTPTQSTSTQPTAQQEQAARRHAGRSKRVPASG